MALTDPWIPNTSAPYAGSFSTITVYRVTGRGGTIVLTALPNVECLLIEETEGPTPSSALFRYIFPWPLLGAADSTAPQSFEQALSNTFTGAKVVKVGDELAVKGTYPAGGGFEWLFDGFPLAWGGHVADSIEVVTLQATGIAKRLWDLPIGGAIMRNADAPATVSDVVTGLVAQFNPRGKPNATPSGANANPPAGGHDFSYPTFLDPNTKLVSSAGPPVVYFQTKWDIAMGSRFILFSNNAGTYVTNPDGTVLDALLVSREPITGIPYDPTNAATYNTSPIDAPDTPLSGRNVVPALHDLVNDYGFGMSFPLTTDGGGNPTTALNLFLKQASAIKSIWLPTRGSNFDPTLCNLADGSFTRDLAPAVNQWTVEGALVRHEVSLILAPGFPSVAGDAASTTSVSAYDTASSQFDQATSPTHDKYRLWLFGESGETYYANASFTAINTVPSLDAIFGAPTGGGPGTPQYVHRRRPPIGDLLQLDGLGAKYKYKLSISTDYANAYPLVWDGTGTWQKVHGGFELLKDRIGIYVNCKNPNGWKIGKKLAGTTPFAVGVVKAVECMATPLASRPAFFLRLTICIEADARLSYTAAAGATSPLTQTVAQTIDAHDRLRQDIQSKCSEYNTTGADVTIRDDTAIATAEAVATQIATEYGVFDGDPIEIPYLTRYYNLGDRIDQIAGRGLGLRTDTGTGVGSVLPVVVKRRFELKDGQRTTLWLSDAGLDRRRFKRQGVRKAVAPHVAAPEPKVGRQTTRDFDKTGDDPRYGA